MPTTLTGYTAGASGANWFLSPDMLNSFNEMAKAAAAATTPVTITITDGYISKYELIRQLTTKHGYSDQTIKDNVATITKNASVTPEQWTALETHFKNRDNHTAAKPAVYKYVYHPYLTNNNGYVSDFPGTTDNDMRRTGNYVRISPGIDPGQWNAAQWLLQNSHTYGFFHTGPGPDVFVYNKGWKLKDELATNLKSGAKAHDAFRLWPYYAAKAGVFSKIINKDDGKLISELLEGTKDNPTWDSYVAKIKDNGEGKDGQLGAAYDAVNLNRPWLLLAEKIYA